MPGVLLVSRPRHDEYVGPQLAYMFDNVVNDASGVDGNDNSRRLGETACLKEARIGRIAIITS